MNLTMTNLKRCLEIAGFTEVKTVLSSGNAAFSTTIRSTTTIASAIEAVLEKQLGQPFHTICRSQGELTALLASDPFATFALEAGAKRVVTFSRAPLRPRGALPIGVDGANILVARGREAFTAYVPTPKGPVFMKLIEKTFGKDVTTRTWDTVKKCAKA